VALLSENGWPCLEASSSKLYTWVIPLKGGKTVSIRMRNGSVGFLLAMAVMLWDARIEPVWQKLLDDWGWAARLVRAGVLPSNHYSGTAVDINATRHPLGKIGTVLRAALWRTLLATRFRKLLRWGGDYHNRKDEMHVEIAPHVAMSQIEARARRLMQTKKGKLLLQYNPSQRVVILS